MKAKFEFDLEDPRDVRSFDLSSKAHQMYLALRRVRVELRCLQNGARNVRECHMFDALWDIVDDEMIHDLFK